MKYLRGAFSEVKMGVHKVSGKKVAIKSISKAEISEDELVHLEREIDILDKLDNPHIIKLFEVFETSEQIEMVLE